MIWKLLAMSIVVAILGTAMMGVSDHMEYPARHTVGLMGMACLYSGLTMTGLLGIVAAVLTAWRTLR